VRRRNLGPANPIYYQARLYSFATGQYAIQVLVAARLTMLLTNMGDEPNRVSARIVPQNPSHLDKSGRTRRVVPRAGSRRHGVDVRPDLDERVRVDGPRFGGDHVVARVATCQPYGLCLDLVAHRLEGRPDIVRRHVEVVLGIRGRARRAHIIHERVVAAWVARPELRDEVGSDFRQSGDVYLAHDGWYGVGGFCVGVRGCAAYGSGKHDYKAECR
jgi:hypothetical protein